MTNIEATTATENNLYETPHSDVQLGDEETYTPKPFSIDGRIGRLRYLSYAFVAYLLIVLVMALAAVLDQALNVKWASGIVVLISIPAMIFAFVVLMKRRLNDLDRSGWWQLLAFIPLINMFIGIYITFFAGSSGPNRFGAKPVKNKTVHWILGLSMPILFGLGILAAIALPAYQDYTVRASAQQSQTN